MALKEILEKVDKLQSKINSFGKLDDEVLKRIHYRFRLDWNYHSNALEGNSLTQQETRSVMINNITVDEKPLKDVMEVRGHDEIISDILKIGKGELKLSEKRIKAIHKAIIHEDDPEQQKRIGVWKTVENHLINYRGEKFSFTPPDEVPEAMHNLLNELNAGIDAIVKNKKNKVHPAFLAFYFHIAYVSIHPFYDGNGRTARILMNLILISFGYPPVIVKVNDKDTYGQYLADIQAYGGSSDLFMEFMGKLLIKSQELVLTAIEGGSIDEPDDLDKKLLLLDKELSAIDPENSVQDRFSSDVYLKILSGWLYELLKVVIPVAQKFNKFFTGSQHYIGIGSSSTSFVNEPPEEVIRDFTEACKTGAKNIYSHGEKFYFNLSYGTLIKGGLKTFGCNYGIEIRFENIKYSIWIDEFTETEQKSQKEFIKERLLHQPLTNQEINDLTKMLGDVVYQHIDFHTKQKGLR